MLHFEFTQRKTYVNSANRRQRLAGQHHYRLNCTIGNALRLALLGLVIPWTTFAAITQVDTLDWLLKLAEFDPQTCYLFYRLTDSGPLANQTLFLRYQP